MKLSKIKPAAPPQRQKTPWRDVAALLRAAPGVWHEIPDAPKTSTTDIRTGRLGFTPRGAFDAMRSRTRLFIRYIGEPVTPWRDDMTGRLLVDPETGEPYTFDALPRDPDYRDVAQPD